MRAITAVGAMFILCGCSVEPEEPRDSNVPRPKTGVVPAIVHVEPFQAEGAQTRPLIMRAVLRCQRDAQGRARCELEVPRVRAPMG